MLPRSSGNFGGCGTNPGLPGSGTHTPIRIGVNAGSLDKRFMQKYGQVTPETLVTSRALWVWSREPLQITAIDAMARVVSSTALPFASDRNLKTETEPARVVSG